MFRVLTSLWLGAIPAIFRRVPAHGTIYLCVHQRIWIVADLQVSARLRCHPASFCPHRSHFVTVKNLISKAVNSGFDFSPALRAFSGGGHGVFGERVIGPLPMGELQSQRLPHRGDIRALAIALALIASASVRVASGPPKIRIGSHNIGDFLGGGGCFGVHFVLWSTCSDGCASAIASALCTYSSTMLAPRQYLFLCFTSRQS